MPPFAAKSSSQSFHASTRVRLDGDDVNEAFLVSVTSACLLLASARFPIKIHVQKCGVAISVTGIRQAGGGVGLR